MLPRLEVDAVQNQIQIVGVRLDLRMVDFADRVLDRQLVKMEHVREDPGFLRLRRAEIHPEHDPAGGIEPGGVHLLNADGLPRLMLEDRDQSPTFTCSAACAAASRATGTRYGEQLT